MLQGFTSTHSNLLSATEVSTELARLNSGIQWKRNVLVTITCKPTWYHCPFVQFLTLPRFVYKIKTYCIILQVVRLLMGFHLKFRYSWVKVNTVFLNYTSLKIWHCTTNSCINQSFFKDALILMYLFWDSECPYQFLASGKDCFVIELSVLNMVYTLNNKSCEVLGHKCNIKVYNIN